jgi:hypothetical protein
MPRTSGFPKSPSEAKLSVLGSQKKEVALGKRVTGLVKVSSYRHRVCQKNALR